MSDEIMKFKDTYYEDFAGIAQNAFLKAIDDHEKSIERIFAKPKEILFYGITSVNGTQVELKRLDSDGNVDTLTVNCSEEEQPIWADTFDVSKLAVVLERGSLTERALPVSDNMKLSISNRTSLSYKGLISEQKCSKIALGKVIEDLVAQHNKNSMQLVVIEGKIQSILTSRYKATEQPVIFEAALSQIRDMDDFEFNHGIVSHTCSTGVWKVKEQEKPPIEAYIRVSDSSTGDAGVTICPVISANGRRVNFDDVWTSRHCKINIEDVKTGTRAAVAKVNDNAKLLADTVNTVISKPLTYARNAIKELNKLAKKMSSIPISKTGENEIEELVETYLFCDPTFTVWDFIEILWEYPEKTSSSDDHISSLEKTVSRILTLNHAELDV